MTTRLRRQGSRIRTRIEVLALAVAATLSMAFVLSALVAPASALAAEEEVVAGPNVGTGNAIPNIANDSADVYGRDNGLEEYGYVSCYFEYGTDTSYSLGSVPCTAEEWTNFPHTVWAELTGLQPGATYHYRLAADTGNGVEYGPDETFVEEQKQAIPGLPINLFAAEPSSTQAGGHPNITTVYFNAERNKLGFPTPCFCQDPENILNKLPTGVIGNPHAVPYCTLAQTAEHRCPPDSQVGYLWNVLYEAFFFSPIYNIEPNPDQSGLLSFEYPFTHSTGFIELGARTGSDYGLDATVKGLTQVVPPEGAQLTLWGVPADPSHNAFRVNFGAQCSDTYAPVVESEGAHPPCSSAGAASTAPRVPFLDNPTTCGVPLTSTVEMLAYDGGVSEDSAPYAATTGCDQLAFNPSLSAQPTTAEADTPSGLEVNLSVPQDESPEAPSPSEIRGLTVKLPEGFSINSSAADGKTACSDSEAKLGTSEEALCPESSKVGTLSLNSAALPGIIPGFVYLLSPQQGNRYRILLSANGFATHVKLVGSITPDPKTGQLTTSFANLPQSPLTDFNIHFFGSEKGLLATPTQCGTYPVESTFRPWDSALPEQNATQFFTLDSGPDGGPCPGSTRPFAPDLKASSVNGTAGVHTPFHFELTRSDGSQNLSAVNVQAPPGLSATLADIPYCSDSALAAASAPGQSGLEEELHPSCPAASEIGTAQTSAGAGTNPVYIPGKVYLAGPYKGAPISLAVITPAVSGPYDLGDVVVRSALRVDPETAQVTAVSDPIPQIIEGIPLRLRSIRVDLNRPNFTLNPTNCNPFAVESEIFGSEGALATPSEHFQVANCRVLQFNPKLNLKLTGGVHRRGHPAIHASLVTAGGEANPASVSVTLPPGELLDNAHIGTVCTKPQFAEDSCPARSLVGNAEAATPLLSQPLKGPVYLRSSTRGLPDLAIDLQGQIPITVIGQVDSVDARLRTTFPTIPDVPVERFSVNFLGGNQGLVQNSENLCGAHKKATIEMTGQNGGTTAAHRELELPCRKGGQPRRARRVHKRQKGSR
ncbi:MAG: fibronectin type III domain-containing protein [Solirubrobacterales bacterium]